MLIDIDPILVPDGSDMMETHSGCRLAPRSENDDVDDDLDEFDEDDFDDDFDDDFEEELEDEPVTDEFDG